MDSKARHRGDSYKPFTKQLDDFVPPHSLEAEMAVLGSMMLSDRAAEELLSTLSEDDIYQPSHKDIFLAIKQVVASGKAIDLVTVKNELTSRDQLQSVGGTEYLIQIAESVPTAQNGAYYAQIVKDKATLRRLEQAGHEILGIVRDPDTDAAEKVDFAESKVFAVAQRKSGKYFESIKSLTKELFKDVDQLLETGEPVLGVPCGFSSLDKVTTGLYGGDLVIIAARPSMGKTALAMNIAANVARLDQGAVAVFSLEMSGKQLSKRMVSTGSRIAMGALKKAGLSSLDYQKLSDASEELYSLPIYIDDASDASPLDVRGKCRRLKAEHGLSLVVVDYLQLMRGDGRRQENRTQEMGEVARGLKGIAKDLDVPVIALGQLNRQVEARTNKRPLLSDIRESGSIEAEADLVVFLYRDEYYRQKEAKEADKYDANAVEVCELIVAKHRNGPTGTVLLAFQPAYTRFSVLDEESQADYFRRMREKERDGK